MKKVIKVGTKVLVVIVGVIFILVFLLFSAKSEIVPEIYATAENGKTAMAVRGAYKWNSFQESIVSDSVLPENFTYNANNAILVMPGEKITLKNSERSIDCYKFYPLDVRYYDSAKNETVVTAQENSTQYADLRYLELIAPEEEGTYTYHFRLSYYNNGEVTYGLKVVVSAQQNYEIDTLLAYRNTKVEDALKIDAILNLLPYHKEKEGFTICISTLPSELKIRYPNLMIEREDLLSSVIAIFILVPDFDQITYQLENGYHVFTRSEVENVVGRSLLEYAQDSELWEQEIFFHEKRQDEASTRDNIYKGILSDILAERELTKYDKMIIDTASFDQEILSLSSADKQQILEYVSDYHPIVCDTRWENYFPQTQQELYIGLSEIQRWSLEDEEHTNTSENEKESQVETANDVTEKETSGEQKPIVDEVPQYKIAMLIIDSGKYENKSYMVRFENDKWNITQE